MINNNTPGGATEQCDDGNTTSGDGCQSDCTLTPVAEVCNALDDNQNGQIDEGCDDDNDNFCDAVMFVTNNVVCPNSALNALGDDCNDSSVVINPAAVEICGNGLDNDCRGGDNNTCDDDNDDFCDNNRFVVNSVTAGCPNSASSAPGDDCNDTNPTVNPAANNCP